MINQVEYAWENVTATYMGAVSESITEIDYDVEEDKKYIYGRGKKVRGIQPGREKPSCSLTIGQSEFEAMIRKAQEKKPNAKATDLVFDIQVHYLKDTDLVKDKIIGFTPTNNPKGMKEGESNMDIKLKGLCMDILYNAQ